MQNITVPYVIYQLTNHSNSWLGLAAFMGFFPALAMGPAAGTIADRFERRRVLLVTQSIQMLLAFALWGMWVAGWATPGLILVNLLLSGVAGGINIASWQSFVPLLVPEGDMLNAVRLNSMQFTGARAFGPAVGGLVLGAFGPATAFMFNAVTFLLVIAVLLAVSPRPHTRHLGVSYVRQFVDGISYVRRRPALKLAILSVAVISFFGNAIVQLAPAFATTQFRVGASRYGFLVTAFGVGAIVGSVLVGIYGDRVRRSRMATIGFLVFPGAMFLLAFADRYALGVAAFGVMGVSYLPISVSLNTSVQARVTERYRGRVISLYLMGLLAGVPFGALIEGRLGDVIGLRTTTSLAAAALLAYTVVAAIRFDRLEPLDEQAGRDEIEIHAED